LFEKVLNGREGAAGKRKVTVMSTKGSGFLLAVGALAAILAGATPALAQSHGGGHSSGGGGGHAGGGAHVGGGGHAGGAAHAPAGGHFAGSPHYGAAGHFAGGGVRGYGGAGYAHGYPAGFHGGAYGRPGGFYGHGYSTGAYWRGGYWHGGFWPRAYYGLGFSWFLPILPLAYATYWYGGVPYYYANDVYYTYDPSYEGYVATDPPPVGDSSAGGEGAAGPPPNAGAGPGPNAGPAPGDGGAIAGQIFMYPKNGQSEEQQAKDKAECQQWAAQQAGQVAQNGSDYQRAMSACVEGRGYSAR
jgi:hypothetical protein